MFMVVGDVQADAPTRYSYSGGNYLLEGCYRTLQYIFKLGKEHKVSAYIFLGDIHTKKDKIPNEIKNMMFDLFEMKHRKADKYIIGGNHDEKDGESSLRGLKPYAQIIDKPEVIEIDGQEILCLPYMENLKQYKKQLKKQPCNMVVGHIGIQGASVGSIRNFNDGIPLKWLKEYDYGLFGHFHRFQKMEDGIYILGSIYQEDWGEAGDTKRVALFDEGELTFEKLPKYINRIDIPINEDEKVKKLLGLKKKKFKKKFKFNENWSNFSRIVTNSEVDIQLLNELMDKFEKYGFINSEPDIDIIEQEEVKIKTTTAKALKKFIKRELKKITKNKNVYREVIDEAMKGD